MTVTNYYVTSDAMGSVTAILDEDGNVLERRSYEAFGEMTCMQPDGSPVEISPTGVDVGFQGQIRVEVTGRYQMGYRWYNPALGRWLSRDPVGLTGGKNLYRVARNNLVTYVDWLGLSEGEVVPGTKRIKFCGFVVKGLHEGAPDDEFDRKMDAVIDFSETAEGYLSPFNFTSGFPPDFAARSIVGLMDIGGFVAEDIASDAATSKSEVVSKIAKGLKKYFKKIGPYYAYTFVQTETFQKGFWCFSKGKWELDKPTYTLVQPPPGFLKKDYFESYEQALDVALEALHNIDGCR
jgi:RHS repeat-associated protein